MGPSDMPKEPPKSMEVRPAKANPEVSKFLDEWINPGPTDKSGGKMGTTVSLGQIDQIDIPPGWQEGTAQKPTGGSSLFREFHPADNPEVRLCFYYRGRRISEEAGQAFHSMLEQPPHVLKPEELQPLREVLREKLNSKDFNLLFAKTEEMNGKRVLVVEGAYNNSQLKTRELFVDSDGTGTAVQEIYYQAPRNDYARFQPAALSALKSIRWK